MAPEKEADEYYDEEEEGEEEQFAMQDHLISP